MKSSRNLYIGTSGWHYKHWIGKFYPVDLPKEEWLNYYMRLFHSVEINNSFYHLPLESTFKKWEESTPADFLFSVKASRFITHMKKLKDPVSSTEEFFKRVSALKNKLGPILFQLPPKWRVDVDRLKEFLTALPSQQKYTFEFRDASWFSEQVYSILASHNAAFCIYEINRQLSPKQVTADFVYIRLHGPDGAYQGSYSDDVLHGWSKDIASWLSSGKAVYCYFDNDDSAFAVDNARTLQAIFQSG